MITHIQERYAGDAWRRQLGQLLREGKPFAPRGQAIREILGMRLVIEEMSYNVILDPARGLNHKFMVAEWLWMWFGRDDVATIVRYNKNIAQFSDNGVDFNGAYGVPIKRDWAHIRRLLESDRDSRQAVIAIFKPQGATVTRDVPCTISLQFLIREDVLHCIATMRSSDIWLGLPYDIFNFSMLAMTMAAELKAKPGSLTLQLGSSHIYERDIAKAEKVFAFDNHTLTGHSYIPELPPSELEIVLTTGIITPHLTMPWSKYVSVLTAPTLKDATLRIP